MTDPMLWALVEIVLAIVAMLALMFVRSLTEVAAIFAGFLVATGALWVIS